MQLLKQTIWIRDMKNMLKLKHGDKGSTYYFKYIKSQDDIVTKKQYDSAYKDWLKEKAKSNDKAQKDLAKHVK